MESNIVSGGFWAPETQQIDNEVDERMGCFSSLTRPDVFSHEIGPQTVGDQGCHELTSLDISAILPETQPEINTNETYIDLTTGKSAASATELSQHQEQLAALRADLARSVSCSKSPTTLRIYSNHFERFRAFTAQHKLSSLPAQPDTVALFLQQQLSNGNSSFTLSQAFGGINWAHKVGGFEDFRTSALCRRVIEHAARRNAVTAVPSPEPATTPEHTLRLLHQAALSSGNICQLRSFAVCTLLYAGLRFAEVSFLRVRHVTFTDIGICLQLTRGEFDQRQSDYRMEIAATPSDLCAVAALLEYWRRANRSVGPDDFVFRSATSARAVTSSNTGKVVRGMLAAQNHPNPASVTLDSFYV